ncbi:MAG: hypothetical protein QOF45_455 [Gaiellaceae bacterium]|jgi:hypothetical protein|nr:hypothetical protein [Gaiellaceae bacterium]
MRKLPQADELPHADEGYDPARVEEAFATFADRVRELESVASELRAELKAIRAERVAPARYDNEDWPAEARVSNAGFAPSPDWVAAVPPPFARRPAAPRLVVEGAFLLLVAILAGLADLAAAWIVLVMAVAWGLVALTEWAAAAKRARWRLDEIAPPAGSDSEQAADTGPWDMPVVEATVVESGPDPESKTIVAKLPVEPDESVRKASATPAEPRRRGLRLRRRRAADPSTPDPWEA